MRDRLVTYFNDGKPAHANSLEAAINALPGVKTLGYAPAIDKHQVGPRTVAAFEKPLIPTFAFIDPYGYKGLSLGLVNAIIKDWVCECLFFFNYNRINPGINNPAIARHTWRRCSEANDSLALRGTVHGMAPARREMLVMEALTEGLQELAGKYVVSFRFRMDDADRTSHYLVFVSKKFLGYKIMRDVMGVESYDLAGYTARSTSCCRSPVLAVTDAHVSSSCAVVVRLTRSATPGKVRRDDWLPLAARGGRRLPVSRWPDVCATDPRQRIDDRRAWRRPRGSVCGAGSKQHRRARPRARCQHVRPLRRFRGQPRVGAPTARHSDDS